MPASSGTWSGLFARPGAQVGDALLTNAPSTLTGVTYRLYDLDGNPVGAASTSVEYIGGDVWRALPFAAPATGGQYLIRWTATGGLTASELLTVNDTGTPVVVSGPFYASAAYWRDYSDLDLTAYSDPALEAILRKAERELDIVGFPGVTVPPLSATGLKYDPAGLLAYEADAIARATCAQADWRVRRGTDLDTGVMVKDVVGPDFRETRSGVATGENGASGLFSPRVAIELQPIAHLRGLTARMVGHGHARRAG